MTNMDCKLLGLPVLGPSEIKDWDSFTIIQERIESHVLMERAALQCSQWIQNQFSETNSQFVIFCGPGNNGGDGLAIARLLIQNGFHVTTIVINPEMGSRDFHINLQRLHNINHSVQEWQVDSTIKISEIKNVIAIDAIFGIGLNKSINGKFAEAINYINQNFNNIVSIDIPSGLFANQASFIGDNASIIKANFTLTFQAYKLALLAPENAVHFGETILLNIDLSPSFLKENIKSSFPIITTSALIKSVYKLPNKFNHKGNNGHAVLIGGSFGNSGR